MVSNHSMILVSYIFWLVVYHGIPTPLKNMKVSWDYYFQLNGKIIQMFQTTNHIYITFINLNYTIIHHS